LIDDPLILALLNELHLGANTDPTDQIDASKLRLEPHEKTLRRCYSRVKEHGIGKRKSSYTIEQLEKVFGQGGWDSQSCAPVLINSSGLYQEMESDSSTLEDFSQEDWCNQVLDSAFQEGDMETEEIQVPKNRALQIQIELSEQTQKRDTMQTGGAYPGLAIFGVGYNTRWREDVRYHYAEISSQVPLGKRLREYFNPEKPEGRVIMTKVQKMNWKNVYYKFLDITISEARCLELHMEVEWTPVSQSRAAGCSRDTSHYLLPVDIPKAYGLYAIGYEAVSCCNDTAHIFPRATVKSYLRGSGKHYGHGEPSAVTCFLQENCRGGATTNQSSDGGEESPQHFAIYIKFIEVELDFLSAGSLVECLETAIGCSLKYNIRETL
ncbi:hypothetical protein KUCAC02_002836, partial [Chaenocephalus aceratus]